jgi:dipeptidyl aminopeptidase/acylaminoacyl peptidase
LAWSAKTARRNGHAMIVEAGAALAGLWSLRGLVHGAILRGLRAPRVPHDLARVHPGVPADRVREVRIPAPRGTSLAGWLAMPSGAGQHPVPAVLVMHGWGANAAMMWPVVPPLHQSGLAVLLIDARCHGHSDGEAFTSMPRFAEDIAAGLAWLKHQPDIDTDKLALLGHSVGAAACLLHASRHHDVRAVVSLSAFAHPRELMRGFMADKRVPYPVVGWYVMRHVQQVIGARFDDIAPVNTIAGVQCPVLVVHGRQDAVVPAGDAVRLVARSGRARLLQLEGDHDLREALAPHVATVLAFLHAACAPHGPAADGAA